MTKVELHWCVVCPSIQDNDSPHQRATDDVSYWSEIKGQTQNDYWQFYSHLHLTQRQFNQETDGDSKIQTLMLFTVGELQ